MSEKDNEKLNMQSLESFSDRFGELYRSYSGAMSEIAFRESFLNAAGAIANMPSIQNRRVKAISPLPADYTKEQIGEFLRNPYDSEIPLGEVAETLKYTAYPWFKVLKTYADIPTYRHYVMPMYIDREDVKKPAYKREERLLDKFVKQLSPEKAAHKIAALAGISGKVYFVPRVSLDREHNRVNFAFLQQLPQNWTQIVGFNDLSGYTVSFNLMYFLRPGNDPAQFGDLFMPYMDDFYAAFDYGDDTLTRKTRKKARYYTVNNKAATLNVDKVRKNAPGSPRVWRQDGEWMYYVTLPIEKVWTFEIDDSTAAAVSPFAGLMLTFAQQADYESAQLALLVSPLIKIFTGEIPYFPDSKQKEDDGYRLSDNGRLLFEALFNNLMAQTNTGGVCFYSAPFQNIKSHDFPESANANNISTTFNRYGLEKAGLAAILPATNDPKAGLAELSAKLESRFMSCIYRDFERMMNFIISTFNLEFEWSFKMFGTIYDEDSIRQKAEKALANGDTSAHYILAALDGQSFLDKYTMCTAVKESGYLDLLIPPITSYTMKQELSGLPPREGGGRPEKTADDMADGDGAQDNDHTVDYKA